MGYSNQAFYYLDESGFGTDESVWMVDFWRLVTACNIKEIRNAKIQIFYWQYFPNPIIQVIFHIEQLIFNFTIVLKTTIKLLCSA